MASVYSQLLTVQERPARVWRGGTGKPLVLLHGEMGDASTHWRWCWPALADHYSVYAPDLPGFGGMTAPLPSATMQGYVDWTFALLDVLQLEGIALAGNSFGATLARRVAADRPARTTRLVLVNGGSLHVLPDAARAVPLLAGALAGRGAVTPQTLDKAIADAARLTPEFVAETRRALTAFGPLSAELARAGGPKTAVPACPLLILWGTGDRLAPLKSAQALARELPKAALRPIENAGRMPQMEQTETFVSTVRQFVG